MNTTQMLIKVENRQPEPQRNLVDSIPVIERKKLSNRRNKSIQVYSWEDFRGLSFGFEDDWN